MKKHIALLIALVLSSATVFAQKKAKLPKNLEPGIYAAFYTSKGLIVAKLEAEKAPMTVANFVGLAEGDFTAFDTIKFSKPYYDGLKFHRVIKNFMIQGGDPQGTGSGGPGYSFYDETRTDLKHDVPGILSMANSDPQSKQAYSNTGRTNGSQFFITHVATPWLDGKHTVFGHVIQGQNFVDSIAQDDLMKKVKIVRVGKEAKAWNATAVFKAEMAKALEAEKVRKAEQAKKDAIEKERIDKASKMTTEQYKVWLFEEIKKTYPNAMQTASGLIYVIEREGNGTKAQTNGKVSTHYKGTFLNGEKFDASYDRGQPLNFKHNVGQMIKGYDEGVALLSVGGKGKFIIPYYDAYGKSGRAPMIPPYCDLMFEIELLDAQPGDDPMKKTIETPIMEKPVKGN